MAAVITGANAYIRISGEVVAFAGGVSVIHDNNLEEIAQLDSLEVAEYAENGHRCQVTINTIKLAPEVAVDTGISNTGAYFGFDHPEGELRQILLQPELVLEIMIPVPVYGPEGDIVDYEESAVYIAYGAKFAGGSGQLTARGVWQGEWRFKARRGVGI